MKIGYILIVIICLATSALSMAGGEVFIHVKSGDTQGLINKLNGTKGAESITIFVNTNEAGEFRLVHVTGTGFLTIGGRPGTVIKDFGTTGMEVQFL